MRFTGDVAKASPFDKLRVRNFSGIDIGHPVKSGDDGKKRGATKLIPQQRRVGVLELFLAGDLHYPFARAHQTRNGARENDAVGAGE
jgi:hypothetical protein